MSKMRLKFSKLGMGKYISHLDLLRAFTRAIHRAELPVRYSQGFNPHQLITFSLPLALGVTGEGEFVDIDFEDGTDPAKVIKGLNKCLPPDIRILEASVPVAKAKDIISAEYIFDLHIDKPIAVDKIKAFFNQKEISVLKKTKKGEKAINLAEYIHEYSVVENNERKLKIRAVLSAGGENNIKPGIVAECFCKFVGALPENAEIHRTVIYFSDGKSTRKFV